MGEISRAINGAAASTIGNSSTPPTVLPSLTCQPVRLDVEDDGEEGTCNVHACAMRLDETGARSGSTKP